MAKPWSAVSASSEFKALPPEQQDGARRQYFDEVVAPQVPEGDRDLAWGQFSTDTGMGRRELPAGVAPSAAGGGRGSVNPLPDEAANPVLQRNKQYAKPAPAAGGYRTTLSQAEESEFGDWVRKNRIPNDDSATSDYDMRGYFRAMKSGVAGGPSINANDGMPHFPDTFKTPYHKSFSNESRYANADAPRWNEQDQLVDKAGRVIFDERKEGQPVPALSNDKGMVVADVTPAASGDASGAGDGAAIVAAAQPQSSSVLEGMQMPERPFDPAEGARLSNRAVAEATPMPGSPRRAMPEMRASTGLQPTTINTERGQALQDASLPVRAAFKAVSGAAQGAGGVIRSVGDATGISALQRAGAETTKGASEFEAGMGDQGPVDGFGPKSPVPYLSNMAEGAASSLAQSAAYASMFGAKAVIPLMSVMTAGQEYDKARTAGLSPAAALAGAIPKGAFEAIGEKFTGLDKVAGAMGTLLTRGATAQAKEEAAKTLIHSGIKEIPGEVITYLGQTGVDLLPGIGLNPDLTMGQFVDGLRDTVVQAGMMGGAMGAGGAAIRADPRIKRLRDAGETGAADLLQSQLDKQNTAASVDNELTGIAPLADFAKSPEFQADYRAMRTEGIKPVEAAGRSALTSTFRGLASTAGMPEKAVNAAMDAAKKVGLDKLPGFLQRFTASLAAKGLIQPVDGMDTLGTSLEQTRDHAMNAAIGATLPPEDVRTTMDSVQALENAQNPVSDAQAAELPASAHVDFAAHDAATSPLNNRPEPTDGQKEAGNYKVGRVNLHGLNISIENPEGSTRSGTSPDGTKWENTLAAHYGYIRGTEGNDGDHVDTFIGPNPASDKVFVVDQVNKDGSFDEHKVMLGADSLEQADELYHANYAPGWTGRGAITEMPLADFKAWVKDGVKTQPVGILDSVQKDAVATESRAQPAINKVADSNVQDTPVQPLGATQVKPETAATQTGTPAGSQPEGPATAGAEAGTAALEASRVVLGRNNVPLTEGGKAFKTRLAADEARKLQPAMRVIRAEGGFALTEKTPAQLAAQDKAARRLRNPQTSPAGEAIPAHAMIAAAGGLAPAERADMGMDGNVKIGNRNLFAGAGKGITIERATEKLVEDGYLPDGAGHDQARALIKRSLTQPQYTPEGTERMAEADKQAKFEASMAEEDAVAEVEETSDNQWALLDDSDIPEVGAASNISEEDAMRILGYTEQEIQDATANRSGLQSQAGQDRAGTDAPDAGTPQGGDGQRTGPTGQDSQSRGAEPAVTPQTPSTEGVSASAPAFPSEARADGTLAVKGDAAAIREALSTIPAKSLMAMKGGILVGRTQAGKAAAILRGETPKMTAREAAEAGQAAREAEKKAKAAAARAKPASEGLTVGIMPGNAEPVTVRDGVVYIGKYAAQNFDTGEDVTVPAGATDQQIVDALKSGGALAQKQRVFGLKAEEAAPTSQPAEVSGRFANNGSGLNDAERELRSLSKDSESPGDVLLGNGKYVPFADVVRIAREGIDAGAIRPVPAQLQMRMDLSFRDVDRILAAAQNPLSAPTKEDVLAQQQRKDEGAKAEAKEKTATENKAKADAARSEFTLTGSDRAADVSAAGGQGSMFARDDGHPGRSRPRSTITFAQPITGPSGKKLTAYTWQWKPVEFVDARGEERVARISDWEKSEKNAETGRDVVHQFIVDGQSVSLETAARMLGYESANAGPLKATESAVKTVARLRMQLEEFKQALDAYGVDKAKVDAMTPPAITGPDDKGWYNMAETQVRQIEPGALREERRRTLIDHWRSDQLAEMGWRGGTIEGESLRRQHQDLLDRAMRAERKVGINQEVAPSLARKGFDADAFSRMFRPPTAMAVSDVQKAVDQLSKGWKSGPTIKVVATPADLPIDAPADARGLIHDGTAYVVAGNHLNRDGVARTLGHEAVGHYGLWRMLGEDGQARFERNLQLAMRSGNTQLVFGAGTGKLVKLSDKVRANYLDKDGNYTLTPAEESSEIAAFAVENAIDPATGQFKPGFGFVKEVYAKVAEFLRSLGIYVKFTNVELQGMLMAAMRGLKAGHKLEGGGHVMVAAARDGAADVGNVLLELGRQDGLFQMPRSESRDLTEIAQAKGLKVAPVDRNSTDNKLWMLANTTPADAPGVQSWIVTLPNGKHGTLTNDKGKVYINVSSVGEGNRGNAIYDLAANYAATNGMKFVGDPNGVSPAAMRRRLENMLSSAIKYGTTDHLEPHSDQLEGNKAIDVPPLQWTEGDTLGNINAMVAASTAATEASNPVSTSNVHFDAATQSFRDGENHRLDDASLSAMLGFDGRESGTGSAGRATLQRNALFRALLQSEGARRAFLEQLRDERRGGGSGTGGGLKGSFYARGDAAPRVDQTAAQSRGKNEAVTAFNNASGDFNPELDAFWLKKGRQEINGDGMPDDEYHQAVAEYANSWRLDKLLEEQGWVRRGSSNVSSSTYFTKYIEDPASGDEKKYEIRVSDHDDRHPADFDIEQRFQVNFRDGTAQWSDADLGPELSSAEITDRLKDILPNESTAPDSGGATAFARGTGNLFQPNIWSTPDPTRTDRVIYELQDGKVDLKRVQEAITKSGQQITEQYDARLAETLYPGRVAYRSKSFLDTEAKPLLEAMARNKVEMDELADYLHARGAKERNAQIAKVNPNMPDGGAGTNSKGVLLTNQAAQDYLANVKPARKVVLDAMAKRVDAITAGTRSMLVDEGLEKQETIDAWEAAYKNYVPMFRDEAENAMPPHPQGSGFSVKGSASKRATGSTKEVTNILAHVLMQREAAITRAEKNRVALALYGQALSHPNPDFWTTIKPSMDAAQIGVELQNMGVDPLTASVGMAGVPTIRTVDPITNKVVDRPNPMYRNLPGAIPLKVNGEDRVLMLNVKHPRGQRLAESLKNLDGLTQLDLANSIIGKSTRWLAAVNTQYNPAFGLVNLTRDVLEGAINIGSTELRGNTTMVLAQVPLALQGIARELANGKGGFWGDLYRQFVADGGQTGFKESFRDPGDRAKKIEKELAHLSSSGKLTPGNAAHAALDLLDGFNTTLENAVRLSAYKVALDKGMSRAKAARLARELTVDFNRKGRAGREIGPLYAFFNASVQGAERALRTLKGPTGGRILAGGLALGVIQAMMLAAAGYDDDEIPEFVKTRAFVIPLNWSGKGEKTHILIPLPLGFLMVPNTGRVLTELTLNGGKDMGKRIFEAIGTIAGSFNPLGGGNIFTMDGALKTVAPTLIDPLIEIGFNKNFAGGQIEKQGYGSETDGRPGVARTKESTQRSMTGQAYMGISKAINTLAGGNDYQAGVVSPTPERVRYLAQTVGGGVLREIEKTINASTATAHGEKVKSSQIPVAGRFYGEVDDDQVQMSRYFEGAKKLKTLESSLKAAKQAGDGTAMLKMIETHPEIAFIKAQAKVQSEISGLNKLAVSTVKDPETIKVIDKARVEKMKALNGAIEELEKANGKVTLGDRLKSSVKPHMAEAKP